MMNYKSNNMSALFVALTVVAVFTSSSVLAFNSSPLSSISKTHVWGHRVVAPLNNKGLSSSSFPAATILFSTPSEDNEETKAVTTADLYPPSSSTAAKSKVVEEIAGTSYPIDLPSPILLASSMVLAIASIGSLFNLISGQTTLGFAPTVAIVVVGLPTCLFLFYAAIRKGTAETEEDDKKFTSGR
mmetsp:Transcript_38919/g.56811  ORF Transcript_38919/g.56811 Transcript_38919/m.56811 type:complete len:186 (+) Transcript_38919:143-700(+)